MAVGADADESPHGHRVQHAAAGPEGTRSENGAGVDASRGDAREPRGTIGVDPTLGGRNGPTLHVRVAGQTRRTPTLRAMIDRDAFRRRGARVSQGARVHALSIETRLVVRAILVPAAAGQLAPATRVSHVTRRTPAVRLVVQREALCVVGAGIPHEARIHASLSVTGLVQRAVAVRPAAD